MNGNTIVQKCYAAVQKVNFNPIIHIRYYFREGEKSEICLRGLKIGKIDLLLYILFFAFLLHELPAIVKNSFYTGLKGSITSNEKDILWKSNFIASRTSTGSSGSAQTLNTSNK